MDRKFRSGKESLFDSLKQLEDNLLDMYNRDESRLKESLKGEQEENQRLAALLSVQRERSAALRQELARLNKTNRRSDYGDDKKRENQEK